MIVSIAAGGLGQEEVLTNADVLAMAAAGLGEDLLVGKMAAS